MKKEINERVLDTPLFLHLTQGAFRELSAEAERINGLNVFPVPDGDTGDNMLATIAGGIKELNGADDLKLTDALARLKNGTLLGARGNSGVILSQLIAGVADALSGYDRATPSELSGALQLGVSRAYSAVSTPTEGTILTVAREGAAYAAERLKSDTDVMEYLKLLAEGMSLSLDRTPELLPALKNAGVVDSGGAGLLSIVNGAIRGFSSEDTAKLQADRNNGGGARFPHTDFNSDSAMTYGYCTELLVQLMRSKCDPEAFDVEDLRDYLSRIGDSVVAFSEGSKIKLHVHTFTPEKVLAYMRRFGELILVKIENMSISHSGALTETNEIATVKQRKKRRKSAENAAPVTQKCSFIAVADSGAGEKLLASIGADITLGTRGGESPSAKSFFDRIRASKAENVFIFPNDKNSVLTANQAAELIEGKKVTVIPTGSIAECYAVLSMIDRADEPIAITETAGRVLSALKCASLAPTVRTCTLDGISVKRGDTVGIIGKRIVAASRSVLKCAEQTLTELLSDGSEMLTIFFGRGYSKKTCERIKSFVKERFPTVEMYTVYSGQAIYSYIFMAE